MTHNFIWIEIYLRIKNKFDIRGVDFTEIFVKKDKKGSTIYKQSF